MKKIVIELFPVEKSCPQGCPPCPLAKRGNKPMGSDIDAGVNASFQALEEVIARQGRNYAFYFLGPGDRRSLLPTMSHPHLINEVAFAIDKVHQGIDPKALTDKFVEETRAFLAANFDPRPSKLRISLVPEKLFVQEKEYEILRLLIKGFQDTYGTKWKEGIALLLEIRSNLVPHRDLLANLAKIKAGDRKYIERIMLEQRGPMKDGGSLSSDYSVSTYNESTMYYSKHQVWIDKHEPVDITNRVLAKFKGLEPVVKNYRNEAIHEMVLLQKIREADSPFAIAPRGVMFFHASVRINNPLFWMTHEDFQTTLQARKDDPTFRIEDFGQQILIENTIISHYQVDKKDVEFSFNDWLKVFATGRGHLSPDIIRGYMGDKN